MRRLTGSILLVFLTAALYASAPQAPAATTKYFPAKGSWEKRDPGAVGLDKTKLDEAIAFALANEQTSTKDLAIGIPQQFRAEAPYNTVIGPTKTRAGMSGLVIRRGYVAAEWGDTASVDMTFSVTKSFLSTTVGILYDRGLIKNLNDKVGPYMPAGVDLFTSEKNAPITWDHLLRQTSDWYGELWGKPDWADRPQNNGPTPADWPNRPIREPGTFFVYNDTRVNVLSLAALYVVKRPLPVVLKEAVMDPIGASDAWHWEPYDNAYATINGRKMPSVPGGGHHGGGMFISAWDMARFGYLFLHNGKWGGKQLVSEKWIGMAKTPGTGTNAGSKTYGFMNWYLNVPGPMRPPPANSPPGTPATPGPKMYPAAPNSAVAFRGNGENLIYIDWENDMVVVVRWIGRNAGGFFERVLAAVKP